MAWRSTERVEAQGPIGEEGRKTFRAGYSDGYLSYPRWASSERGYHPGQYESGFEAGRADRKEED